LLFVSSLCPVYFNTRKKVMAETKPRIIVLGGVGFIGRHVVELLATKASHILVADKVLPALAPLTAKQAEVFNNKDLVTFAQVNLAREQTVKPKVFEAAGGKWDYVINCCGASKYSQDQSVYNENTIDTLKTCAKLAAEYKVKRFVEISGSQMYDSTKKPATENDKLKPWTLVSKAKLECEKFLATLQGLDYVIIRPAIVYGVGDMLGLTPRLIAGAIYKEKGKGKMKLTWDKTLRINTVHVKDLAEIIYLAMLKGEKGAVFNASDSGDTSQGSMAELLLELFGVKTEYAGKTLCSMANTKFLTDLANDKHLKPWTDITKKYKIDGTPLTPYLDSELLLDNDTYMDGSMVTSKLGYKYQYPHVTKDSLKEIINDFVTRNWFPKDFVI